MGDRKNINKPEEYPIEGLPTGTYVRSHRLNKLGVITDAFYEEPEVNNQKNNCLYYFNFTPDSEYVFWTIRY